MMKLTYFFFCWLVFFYVFADLPELRAQDSGAGGQDSDSLWLNDYRQGLAEAKASGKDLLLVFTGTDWIDICKKFDTEILSKAEFTGPVSKHFVLVKLEFPKRAPKPPGKELKQNFALKDAYRVRGYPVVMLTDARRRPYAVNGFQPVKAEVFAQSVVGMFQEKQRKYALLAKAETLSGPEKAGAIVEGIPELPGNLSARFFAPEMKAAIAAAPDDRSGKMARYKKLIADVNYANEMSRLRENVEWTKMLKLSDRYIGENPNEKDLVQRVLMNKIGIYKHLNNLEGVVKSLILIVKTDPKSQIGKAAQKALDKLRAKKLEQDLAPIKQ